MSDRHVRPLLASIVKVAHHYFLHDVHEVEPLAEASFPAAHEVHAAAVAAPVIQP